MELNGWIMDSFCIHLTRYTYFLRALFLSLLYLVCLSLSGNLMIMEIKDIIKQIQIEKMYNAINCINIIWKLIRAYFEKLRNNNSRINNTNRKNKKKMPTNRYIVDQWRWTLTVFFSSVCIFFIIVELQWPSISIWRLDDQSVFSMCYFECTPLQRRSTMLWYMMCARVRGMDFIEWWVNLK